MRRAFLPLVTLALALLILVDRIGHMKLAAERAGGAVQGPNSTQSGTAHPDVTREVIRRDGAAGRAGGEIGDRLVRLATRERLSREASGTYLDSLIVSTDSVVRRWPDRWGTPIKVHIVEGGVPGYLPKMADFARDAFDRWENTGVGAHVPGGIRLGERGRRGPLDRPLRLRPRRTDRSDLGPGGPGAAGVDLARASHPHRHRPARRCAPLRGGARGGACLGLPHSSDTNDVMFPATRTGTLTDRDRRTIEVLYRLPPGPVRDELAGH